MDCRIIIQFSYRLFLYGFIAAGLSACGVPTSKGTPADTETLLNLFDLTGNTDPIGSTERVGVTIGAGDAEASGLFSMSWDVTSSDPYQVVAFISTDASLSQDADDDVFLVMNCGSDNSYICDALGDMQCAFVYSPELDPVVPHYFLRCGNGPATTRVVEITNRMANAGFPGTNLNNSIVFQACNGAGDSCQSALVQVEVFDSTP